MTEFFGYSINRFVNLQNLVPKQYFSILYQRGIYPPEDFAKVTKYGLAMLVTKDESLKKYLSEVLKQLSSDYK